MKSELRETQEFLANTCAELERAKGEIESLRAELEIKEKQLLHVAIDLGSAKAERDKAERSFIELCDKLDQAKAQRDELAAALRSVVLNYSDGYIHGHATVIRQARAALAKLEKEGE